jgi:hypothetical protein
MSEPVPPSYGRFKGLFLADFYPDITARELFQMLLLRLEHLQNLPLESRDREELKLLTQIRPWALDPSDHRKLRLFERAVRVFTENDDEELFDSEDSCRAFLTRHEAPPLVVQSTLRSSPLSSAILFSH